MILAGDIGGTHARLAFFQSKNGHLTPVAEGVFPSRDHSGLDEIVGQFVAKQSLRPDVACFGVAGPVRNGKVETSNLPWTVEASRLAGELHLASALLINDLEANAWGIASLGDQDQVALNRVKGMPVGNQGVISAGTGLGEAGLFWNGNGYEIFASEGGHCDFAPRTELEIELLRYLVARFGHVSFERIVSGPGLVNVYNFLRDTHRAEEPQWLTDELAQGDQAATISRAAVAGKSVLAEHALDLWISIYGAEAGNLALRALARGGLYVGGGIAPRIISKLSDGVFLRAFCAKGRMTSLLESIPVRVILNDQTGLLGAARYANSQLLR